MSDANYDIEGMYDEGIDHEIIKGNRDTLLERMNESGNAYSDEYPYGLMGEAEEEIKLLRKERDEANFLVRRILSEINCRIDRGADSNGHLEGIYELFKKEETP